jgi:hypothetical protein
VGDVPEPWSRYPTGSRIARIDLARPDAAAESLSAGLAAAGGVCVSFDAADLLFVGKQAAQDRYGVWTCAADGSEPRNLIAHPTDCGAAAFLPDGRIVYAAAVEGAAPHPRLRSAWALFVAPADGGAGTRITFSGGADLDPTVLVDGRILYASWQPGAAEDGLRGGFGLFTVHPDGTGVAPFHGHHVRPDWKLGPRQADDGTVFFVAHDDGEAPSVRGTDWRAPLDGGFAFDSPAGPVVWAERGGDRLLLATVAAGKGRPGGVALLRRDGTVESGPVAVDGGDVVVQASLLAPRRRPQGHLSMVAPDKGHGTLFCVDARPPGDTRGVTVRLRTRRAAPTNGGGTDAGVLGALTLEEDGSFFARVPPDTPLWLDLLDDGGRVVVRGVTPFWVRPNESRGCVGCHEHPETAPPNRRPLAVTRDPVSFAPGGAGMRK